MNAANSAFLAASRADAMRGLWPNEYKIAQGTVLYRFVSRKRRPPALAANGPWWFEFEHYQTIKHFALRNGYSTGYAARLFAAILYEWSEVDAVVRAQAVTPLVAWKGRGKQVVVGESRPLYEPELDPRDASRTPKGLLTEAAPLNLSKMTPVQGPKQVYQLFIPGLGRTHSQFRKYLTLLSTESIATV